MPAGIAALPLLLFAAAVSAAQTNAPKPATATMPCDLHVWPSEGLSVVRQKAADSLDTSYLGLLGSSPQARANNDRTPVRTAPASATLPLTPAAQVALLTSAPLPELLGLPAARVVLHDAPIDGRTLRTVRTRYVGSTAPCYADLVVDDVVYSREYARGRNLKTFLRFRQFGDGAAPVRAFGTWVQTKLLVFSIDPPVADTAALTELDAAFRGNLTLFSQLLARR